MPQPHRSLHTLVAEIRRRKVPQAAAVYLVAAWAVVEVADTVFPNLGLPQWTVTLVIALAGLGLPLVLTLAWLFDLSWRGVEREDAEPAPRVAGPSEVEPTGGGRRLVAAAAVLLVLLAAGAAVFVPRGRAAADLDPQLVAVMPFRTAGADPKLAYLRDGLMDLLAASFNGRDGLPTAIPPRSLVHHLEARAGSQRRDLDLEQSLDLARQLGAGRLLQGEVVGGGARLSVHITVRDAADGSEVDDAVLEARPDSLHALIDAIAARWVGADAGLPPDRLASLTTRSLPALRAYLDGQAALRGGRHTEAVDAFDRAIDLDSTFALAAVGLNRTNGWTIADASRNGGRAFRLAWERLHELPRADRLYLQALSPAYPALSAFSRVIRAREEAVAQAPDLPELHYLLGDGLLHYGQAAGVEDHMERSRRELERTVALDSTYIEPLTHLFEMAVVRDDAAGMRRYGDLILAVDAEGGPGTAVRWLRERHGAPLGGPPVRLDSVPTDELAGLLFIGFGSLPELSLADRILERVELAESAADREAAAEIALLNGYMEGRPGVVNSLLEGPLDNELWDYDRLGTALFWARDTARADAAAEEVRGNLSGRGLATDADWRDASRGCFLAYWAFARGGAEEAERLLRALQAIARATPSVDDGARGTAALCSATLAARRSAEHRSPDARRRLQALDELLAEGVRAEPMVHQVAAQVASDLWLEAGDPVRALTTIRRRVMLPQYMSFHQDSRLAEARILDRLGRHEEALEHYRHHLRWRQRAEPPFAAELESVRGRVAELERRRG